MSPAKLVYDTLKANPELMQLVGGRVYPLRVAQTAALPALAYQQVSDTERRLRGCNLPDSGLVQVTVYAKSYAEIEAVSRAIRLALAANEAIEYDNSRDLHDDVAGTYYRPLDFRVETPSLVS